MSSSPVRMLTCLLVVICLRVIWAEEEAMLSAVTVDSKYLSQDTDLPHLVLFFTSWSKYCQRVSSDWEALADKYNNMERQQVSWRRLENRTYTVPSDCYR